MDASKQDNKPLDGLWPEYFKRFPNKQHNIISIFNKQDLVVDGVTDFAEAQRAVAVSAKTGTGLSSLKQLILKTVGYKDQAEGVFLPAASP